MKKRTIALMTAAVMLLGVTVGGTIAWLTAESNDVVNTFTVGNIEIFLDETDVDDTDNDSNCTERDASNEYKMIPGNTYVKDPMVTVVAGSEECYIFIEIIEERNTRTDLEGKIIQYSINTEDWKKITTETNREVYYYKTTVNALEATNNIMVGTDSANGDNTGSTILATNAGGTNITINPNLTQEMIQELDGVVNSEDYADGEAANTAADEEVAARPKLTFYAYAVQAANMSDVIDDQGNITKTAAVVAWEAANFTLHQTTTTTD